MTFVGTNIRPWFDDHFGLRSTLVKWYGETRLFVFGQSPSTSVIKGRNGWFFYADDKAAEDYVSEEPLTPEALANWRSALVRARRWLTARHVAYVFLLAPDKHAMYPEEMPATVVRIGPMSRTGSVLRQPAGHRLHRRRSAGPDRTTRAGAHLSEDRHALERTREPSSPIRQSSTRRAFSGRTFRRRGHATTSRPSPAMSRARISRP